MKKLILFILYLMFSLLASGCESIPFEIDPIYAEIEAAGLEVATTVGKTDEQIADDVKRHDKAIKRLDRYERRVEQAGEHYENRILCFSSTDYAWLCEGRETYNPERPPQTADELVRTFHIDRCGCVRMDDVMRVLHGRY